MKKILLIVFIFISFCTQSQQSKGYNQNFYVPNPFQIQSVNITTSQISNGWAVFGSTCAGCASYYYKITRTSSLVQAEDGNNYYYYYIWFFTNSYYNNGQSASTYLTNINVYLDGLHVTSLQYVLATNQEQYYIWLRSINPNSKVFFQITKMSVY